MSGAATGSVPRSSDPNPCPALPDPHPCPALPDPHPCPALPDPNPCPALPDPNPCLALPDPNPCLAIPNSKSKVSFGSRDAAINDSEADLQQDVQQDSVSDPVKSGPLPPPRRVRGKSTRVKLDPMPDAGPRDFSDIDMEFSRDGVPDLDVDPLPAPCQSEIHFLDESLPPEEPQGNPDALDRDFVTLRWAEPLKNRSADQLRLVIMQPIAKCKAFGVPVLRFHSDRAKEFQSVRLLRWLAEQSIHSTKSAPEDPAANGTAESAVKEIKRSARRSLISSGLPSSCWPLAVRQASELLWRSCLSKLGCPTRPLLAFGTKVQARSREWIKRSDKQWGPKTLSGQLVGPAPQTSSAYVVLLDDDHLYISSSVHPITPVSGSLAASETLPPCSVQLQLLRASSRLFVCPTLRTLHAQRRFRYGPSCHTCYPSLWGGGICLIIMVKMWV